MLNLVIYFVWI